MRDVYSNVKALSLALLDRDTEGSENISGTGVDVSAYNGYAQCVVTVTVDASAAAADRVNLKLREASDNGTTNATDISSAAITEIAGDDTGGTTTQQFKVNLDALDYTFIHAYTAITDGNSSGSYVVSATLLLSYANINPVN